MCSREADPIPVWGPSQICSVYSLQEVMFLVVRISVGFMPPPVGYGIIQVYSLLLWLPTAFMLCMCSRRTASGANICRLARKHPNFPSVYPTCPSLSGWEIKLKGGTEKGGYTTWDRIGEFPITSNSKILVMQIFEVYF